MKQAITLFIALFVPCMANAQWSGWVSAGINACGPVVIKYKVASNNFQSGAYEIKINGTPNSTCSVTIRSYFINTFGKSSWDDETLNRNIKWYSAYGNPFDGIKRFVRAEIVSTKGCTCAGISNNSTRSGGNSGGYMSSQPIDPGAIDGRTGLPVSMSAKPLPPANLSNKQVTQNARQIVSNDIDHEAAYSAEGRSNSSAMQQPLPQRSNMSFEQIRSRNESFSNNVGEAAAKIVAILSNKTFEEEANRLEIESDNEMKEIEAEADLSAAKKKARRDYLHAEHIKRLDNPAYNIEAFEHYEGEETAEYVVDYIEKLPGVNKLAVYDASLKRVRLSENGVEEWGNILSIELAEPYEKDVVLTAYIVGAAGDYIGERNELSGGIIMIKGTTPLSYITSLGKLYLKPGRSNTGLIKRAAYMYPPYIEDGRYTLLLYNGQDLVYKGRFYYDNKIVLKMNIK